MNRSAFLFAAILSLIIGLMALTPSSVVAQGRDRLVLGLPLEPPNLDPTSGAAAAVDEVVYANVFEGLTRLNQTGTVLPALAETWQAAPDGLSWTFNLRRGVAFSDGTPLDAKVVQYALSRITAPDSTNAQKALFAPIERIEVVDTHRVRLHLSRPMANLPYLLAWGDAVMVAPQSATTNGVTPIGTGPFVLESWQRGSQLTLKRRTDYWGTAPRLNRVVFRFISDPTAAFAAVSAGDVDAFPNYPAPENVAQFRNDLGLRVVIGASEGKVILGLNNTKAPFNNLKVRQALAHAIDRSSLINGAMFGFAQPIGSHYSRQASGYVDLTTAYAHDPVLSRRLLAEAGYPQGVDITLRLPPRPYARRSGEVLVSQLAEAGFRVRIENLEWAQWLEQVFKRRQFDMTIVEHVEPMDYDIYGRKDYYFGYNSPTFDALLAKVQSAPDEAARERLLGDLQRLITQDAVNGYLFQSARIGVWKKDLNGLWINAPIAANDVTGVSWAGTDQASATASSTKANGLPWGWMSFIGGLLFLGWVSWRFGLSWVLRKLAGHGLTLLAATVVIFLLLQVVPGDPAAYMMGLNASPEAVAALRQQMGLEGSAIERYLGWMTALLSGSFGTSYTYQVPVGGLIAERLAVSVPLAAMATALSLIIAIPVGVLAARYRGKAVDSGLIGLTQVGVALPNFWLAMLLILLFSVVLGWFSAGGFPGWEMGFWPASKALILPAIALAAPQAAILARVLRTALLDTLNEDYVRTARAKGLSVNRTLWRHALPNALVPVLTILGLQFPFLLAGGIIIENVFSLPGLGRLVFQAITQRDLIVVQGVVVVLVFAVVLVSFLIDVAYLFADPRQRERR